MRHPVSPASRTFLPRLATPRLARPRGFEPLTFGSVGGRPTCARTPVPTANCLQRQHFCRDTSGHERPREDAICSHLVPTCVPTQTCSRGRRRGRDPPCLGRRGCVRSVSSRPRWPTYVRVGSGKAGELGHAWAPYVRKPARGWWLPPRPVTALTPFACARRQVERRGDLPDARSYRAPASNREKPDRQRQERDQRRHVRRRERKRGRVEEDPLGNRRHADPAARAAPRRRHAGGGDRDAAGDRQHGERLRRRRQREPAVSIPSPTRSTTRRRT